MAQVEFESTYYQRKQAALGKTVKVRGPNHPQAVRDDGAGGLLKWCSLCRSDRTLLAFAKNSSNPSGKQNACRDCNYVADRARAFERNAKNRSKRSEVAAMRPPPPPYVPPLEKRCTKCGDVKPLALFGLHQQTRDGRNSWCRACAHAHDPVGRRSRKAKRRAGKLNATPAWADPSMGRPRGDSGDLRCRRDPDPRDRRGVARRSHRSIEPPTRLRPALRGESTTTAGHDEHRKE